MTIQTTTNGAYCVHATGDEFFRIHLGGGRELTLDTSYNQVYYRLRASAGQVVGV
jgi:hypothetical protein